MTIGIVIPNTDLYQILAANAVNRSKNSGYQRIRLKEEPREYIRQYPHIGKGKSLIVGAFQITDMKDKIKYLYQWPFTYGELASEYLHYCLQDIEVTRSVGGSIGPPPPLAFRGSTKGTFAYVDIVACYFSLYRDIAIDTTYTNTGIYIPGSIPFRDTEQLRLSKTLRNTVFGIMRKNSRTRYSNGKYKSTNERSEFYRPMIVNYVLSTTQAIAQEAWSMFPIQQWLTDAAIINMSYSQDLIDYLKEDWCLDAKIEAYGSSHSMGLGRYKVGAKASSHYSNLPYLGNGPLEVFPKVPISTLKEIRREIAND